MKRSERKKIKINSVVLVKEISRERVKAPPMRAIPDMRSKQAENLARSIAGTYGEEI